MIEVEMTSLEIAELCDKRHDNVVRDIKGKFLPKISPLKNEESIFKLKQIVTLTLVEKLTRCLY